MDWVKGGHSVVPNDIISVTALGQQEIVIARQCRPVVTPEEFESRKARKEKKKAARKAWKEGVKTKCKLRANEWKEKGATFRANEKVKQEQYNMEPDEQQSSPPRRMTAVAEKRRRLEGRRHEGGSGQAGSD